MIPEAFAAGQRYQRDGGYLLLAILFMMAMMIILATIEAPRLVQQIKRDREEEMIHRGTEYARAVKKFYKKFGRYPANLEQLDNTNQIRFLRKRYKDPLAKDGKWKLLTYADIQSVILNTQGAPGVPAALLGSQGAQNVGASLTAVGNGSSPAGMGSAAQPVNPNGVLSGGVAVGLPQASGTAGNGASGGQATGTQSDVPQWAQTQGNSQFSNTFSLGSNPAGANPGSSNPGAPNSVNPSNAPFGQNPSAGQAFGGGAIVGVASLNKDRTIRIYNKKKTYNEWMFIYDLTQDRPNVLLRGPYQPMMLGGAQGQGVPGSTPASQIGGQSPFGQQNPGVFGQQPGGLGQGGAYQPQQQPVQQPQQNNPGSSFPPEQQQ